MDSKQSHRDGKHRDPRIARLLAKERPPEDRRVSRSPSPDYVRWVGPRPPPPKYNPDPAADWKGARVWIVKPIGILTPRTPCALPPPTTPGGTIQSAFSSPPRFENSKLPTFGYEGRATQPLFAPPIQTDDLSTVLFDTDPDAIRSRSGFVGEAYRSTPRRATDEAGSCKPTFTTPLSLANDIPRQFGATELSKSTQPIPMTPASPDPSNDSRQMDDYRGRAKRPKTPKPMPMTPASPDSSNFIDYPGRAKRPKTPKPIPMTPASTDPLNGSRRIVDYPGRAKRPKTPNPMPMTPASPDNSDDNQPKPLISSKARRSSKTPKPMPMTPASPDPSNGSRRRFDYSDRAKRPKTPKPMTPASPDPSKEIQSKFFKSNEMRRPSPDRSRDNKRIFDHGGKARKSPYSEPKTPASPESLSGYPRKSQHSRRRGRHSKARKSKPMTPESPDPSKPSDGDTLHRFVSGTNKGSFGEQCLYPPGGSKRPGNPFKGV